MSSDTLCTEQKRNVSLKSKQPRTALIMYCTPSQLQCCARWYGCQKDHSTWYGSAQGSDLRAQTQGLVPRLFLTEERAWVHSGGAKSLTSVMPLLMPFPLGTKNYCALCKAMWACCINRKWTCVQGHWSQTPDQRVFLPLAFVIVVHIMYERRKVYIMTSCTVNRG